MNHILLVDDDNVHHVVTSMLIKRLPFELESSKAMDGLEALNMIKDNLDTPPDLILLDLNMPVYERLGIFGADCRPRKEDAASTGYLHTLIDNSPRRY
jgi:CheY-like chemotaxis protein